MASIKLNTEIVDYVEVQEHSSSPERRETDDRRRFPRTRFCDGCGARLFVDRRGPTVIVRSPVPHASVAGPMCCPMCGQRVSLGI
jgi:hypothetical protein